MKFVCFAIVFVMLQANALAQDDVTYDNIACSGNICFSDIEGCEAYVDTMYDHGERVQRCSENPTRMYCYTVDDNVRRTQYEYCYSSVNSCNSNQTRHRHRNSMNRYSDFTNCSLTRERTSREIEQENREAEEGQRILEQKLEEQRLLEEEHNQQLAAERAEREANSDWCVDARLFNAPQSQEMTRNCFNTIELCNTERQRIIGQNNLNSVTICRSFERVPVVDITQPERIN